MTLTEAKTLLERKRIPYQTALYESEAEYLRHLMPSPYTQNIPKCKVTALVIPSVNGVKNIEMQFNRVRGQYLFEELWFGSFCFDLYNHDPDILEADLLDIIGRIVDGKMAVIECYNLKRKRWVSDSSYDLTDDDNVFGAPGLRDALKKIDAPRTFWQKLTGQKLQYDIYDWRTHRRVVK